jgi:ribonuclease VapC
VLAIDTSAIVAFLRNEPTARSIVHRLEMAAPDARFMAATCYVEAGTVLAGRHPDPARAFELLDAFLASASISMTPVDERLSRLALDARIRFGKGFGHPAQLNFGDSFSYALAKSLDAPLLFTGNDFTQTDIRSALGPVTSR